MFSSLFFYILRGWVRMKALEEKICKEGKVLPGNVLKVGSFLNQQLDVDFLIEMGKETARLYEGEEITKILTIESSGIAVAVGVGAAIHVPVVFAKKNKSANVAGGVYTTVVHSYTHNTDYNIVVSDEYIGKGDKILIVDDFLANGKALRGLIEITEQAGAELVGCVCAIEKGFQRGGDELRREGIRVDSLAIVESMSPDEGIVFRK